MKDWHGAAVSLRSALAHASLWLPEFPPGARNDRLLSREDVQGLYAYFSAQAWVRFTTYAHPQGQEYGPHPLIELYLPWLRDDVELADAVAGAWQEVVQRGEADNVTCHCELCQSRGEESD